MLDLEVQPERSLGNEQWEFSLGESLKIEMSSRKVVAVRPSSFQLTRIYFMFAVLYIVFPVLEITYTIIEGELSQA